MITQGLWLSPDMNFCQKTGKGRTCTIINGFHPNDSVTYSELSTDYYDVYHKKSVGKDILMIGHNMRSANEVKFTYSESSAKWSSETRSTGKLGLGFNSKDGNDTNLIDQLFEKSVINSKVAGFRFRKMRIFEGYQTNAGEITIGAHIGDSSLYTGLPIWISGYKVNDPNTASFISGSNLAINIGTIGIDSATFNISGNWSALINSDNPAIILPKKDAAALNENLGFRRISSGAHVINCTQRKNLLNVNISFGDFVISIPPSDYVFEDENQCKDNLGGVNAKDCEIKGNDSDKICGSAFYGGDFGDNNTIILSYRALHNVYTLLDYGNKRIGFAHLKLEIPES